MKIAYTPKVDSKPFRSERTGRRDHPNQSTSRDRPSRAKRDNLRSTSENSRSSNLMPDRSKKPSSGLAKRPSERHSERTAPSERHSVRSELPSGTKKWGNVARRGARLVSADSRPSDDALYEPSTPPPPMDRWVRLDQVSGNLGNKASNLVNGTSKRVSKSIPSGTSKTTRRGTSKNALSISPKKKPTRNDSEKPALLPEQVAAAIRKAPDSATSHHRELLVQKMENAIVAFERNRFEEAARLARLITQEAPNIPEVRELAGLASYRSGRWREAIRHLRAYRELSDDVEVIPAIMDAQRALGHFGKVGDLWAELQSYSPEPDILAEGRIVAAASIADTGDLAKAIELLNVGSAAKALRNPRGRHLRQWYALADLYERAGDIPRARELFQRIMIHDEHAYDVSDRLRSLGKVKTYPRHSR